MASQCHCLSVNPSAFRVSASYGCSASSSTTCNLGVTQPRVFFRGQRLQSQRLSQPSLSSSSRPLVQCVSSTVGRSGGDGDQRPQSSVTSNVVDKASEPIRAFPWAKVGNVLLRRIQEQFWTVGKWLVIPVLALSVLSELSYTLVQEKVLIVPIGMVCGIVFAGIMKETALELSPSIEEGKIPWHLVALGLLLVAFKFIAPYLPIWGRISVPHFANGGLWQVIVLFKDWRKNYAERKTAEQS
ncbi:hypothetical protein KC19_3G045400 [Ceratodon purpureus]|uniref:Uncharacterized protein n=1 Tax=Ceratodon purpureus TaxID=3225 RepID=A0A8T0IIF9_CERPU|nr:hypothetical protein KC19_3G045400 [Ceratodon purpureus]